MTEDANVFNPIIVLPGDILPIPSTPNAIKLGVGLKPQLTTTSPTYTHVIASQAGMATLTKSNVFYVKSGGKGQDNNFRANEDIIGIVVDRYV